MLSALIPEAYSESFHLILLKHLKDAFDKFGPRTFV